MMQNLCMDGDISNLEICRKAVKGINAISSHQAALGSSVPRSVEDPLYSHMANKCKWIF